MSSLNQKSCKHCCTVSRHTSANLCGNVCVAFKCAPKTLLPPTWTLRNNEVMTAITQSLSEHLDCPHDNCFCIVCQLMGQPLESSVKLTISMKMMHFGSLISVFFLFVCFTYSEWWESRCETSSKFILKLYHILSSLNLNG